MIKIKLGTAYVIIKGKIKDLRGDLEKAERLVKKSVTAMQTQIEKISFRAFKLGAVPLAAFTAGVYKSIKAASDLQEVQGKFDVVFKRQKILAESWSRTLVDSYAMSERESKQYMSSVQDLLVPMGMQADAAARMSNEVVKLAADLGSFNNQSTAQVMMDMQSALVGNFETMKKYGVVLNETVIKQRALALGLYSGKGLVDANTKALVAFKLMTEGSSAAVGDMARTMNSYANQIKLFEASIENMFALVGNELLPIATDIVSKMNEWVNVNKELIAEKTKEGLNTAVKVFANIKDNVSGIIDLIKENPDIAKGGLLAYLIGGPAGFAVVVGATKLLDDFWKSFYSQTVSEDAEKKLKKMRERQQQLEQVLTTEHIKQFGLSEKRVKLLTKELELLNLQVGVMSLLVDKAGPGAVRGTITPPRLPPVVVSTPPLGAAELAGPATGGASEMMKVELKKAKALKEDFNNLYSEMGMTQFEIERDNLLKQANLWEAAGADKIRVAEYVADRLKDIQREEGEQRLEDIRSTTGMMADNFKFIAEMGGKHSKAAFAMYKAFKIVETIISTRSGAMKAYEAMASIPYIGPALGAAAAATVVGFGMAQVATIKGSQPPSYDVGGISSARGIYQTGDIQEAHIPIPSGKIPVKLSGNDKPTIINENHYHIEGNTFYDQEKQAQVFTQLAEMVVWSTAPKVYEQDYRNDGITRRLARSRS